MKKYISVLALIFCVNNIFSQYNYLLQGTVGKYPVVMCMHYYNDTTITARYFYTSSLKDIFLNVQIDEAKNEFTITDEYFDDSLHQNMFTEKFIIYTKDFKTFKGIWTNNLTQQEVKLMVVDTNQIKRNYYTNYDEGFEKYYSILRMQNVKLSKDSTTQKNKLTLQWFSDKESKINMFRVANGIADYGRLKKINKALETYQYKNLYAFYECANNDRQSGEYNYHINDVFITNNFLSIDGGVWYDCGGVHPNESDNNLTINLRTGNVVNSITDIFNLYDDKFDKIDSIKGYNKEYNIGNCILKILKQLYHKQIISEENSNNSCDYTTLDKWQYADFLFRYDGVYFNPYFPHALQSCRYPEWSVIPYAVLKKYLRKESQFVF